MEFSAASVAAVATTGPIQGVQTIPRLTPVINPPENPDPPLTGLIFQCFSMYAVVLSQKEGISIVIPKKTSIRTAKFLIASADISRTCTILARVRENIEKLITNPAITPLILDLFPSIPLDKTIGKIGSTHGEKTVSIPDTKEIGIRKNIILVKTCCQLIEIHTHPSG